MNTYSRLLILTSSLSLTLIACSNKPIKDDPLQNVPVVTNTELAMATADTSQNALDWPGIYKGVMPCADCEGIATTLVLNNDSSYAMSETYTGKSTEALLNKGSFNWNAQGNTITLADIAPGTRSAQFQVGENRLTQLDLQGNKIEGALADKYVLAKEVNSIANKRWKLIELNGKPVSGDADKFFITLMEPEGRVQAKAGCNTISGAYDISGGFRIAFSNMLMTRMACIDMTLEHEFNAALAATDNFSQGDNTLSLNKGRMAPLARFALAD